MGVWRTARLHSQSRSQRQKQKLNHNSPMKKAQNRSKPSNCNRTLRGYRSLISCSYMQCRRLRNDRNTHSAS
jgi:hypothetical protein